MKDNERADDAYCASTNGAACYALAIREIRLGKIRLGLFQPRDDDPEEMAAAQSWCATVDSPQAHRMKT